MELALLQSEPIVNRSDGEARRPTGLHELVESVERSLTSEHSRRAYRTALHQFMNWCAAAPGRNLDRLTILQYKDALIAEVEAQDGSNTKRRFAPATVNLRLAAVRAFAQEAADRGLLSLNDAAAIRRVKGEKTAGTRIGNWIGVPDVEKMLLTADRTSLRGMRDYALLSVLFSTGLRRSEAAGLLVRDLQQRDGQWGFLDLRGKGGRLRNVPVPLWVKDAVFDWLKATKIVQGAIFRSITRHGKLSATALSDESVKLILSSYASRHDLPSFRPHDARRTCARLLRASNAGLEDIKDLLGHSSIQTTERYLGRSNAFGRGITNAIQEPKCNV